MIEKQLTREYLVPGLIGIISGEIVVAKECSKNELYVCPCVKCAILNLNVCFDSHTHKRLEIAPACFGNDEENLSHKSLYYTKL